MPGAKLKKPNFHVTLTRLACEPNSRLTWICVHWLYVCRLELFIRLLAYILRLKLYINSFSIQECFTKTCTELLLFVFLISLGRFLCSLLVSVPFISVACAWLVSRLPLFSSFTCSQLRTKEFRRQFVRICCAYTDTHSHPCTCVLATLFHSTVWVDWCIW